jgi:DNA-binding NtrC family response regulator
MLTVACYMIQHDQYSNEALIWMKQRLYDYLEKGTPAEQIRKQVAQELGQEKRNWKITSQKVESQRSKTPWSMTIMDVATQHHDAESYRNCIEKWAATILKEM